MALTGPFHYRQGASILHRLTPEIKILFMVLISVFITFLGPWGLLGVLLFLSGALALGGAPVVRGFRGRWGFLFFLGAIFILSWLNGPLNAALLLTSRLALLLITANIFTSSTSPGDMAGGVKTLLSPLPGEAGEKLGAHLRLFFILLPLVFDEAEEVSLAQRARGVTFRRRPLRRMVLFSTTFLIGVFSSAQALSEALDSRGWRGLVSSEHPSAEGSISNGGPEDKLRKPNF